MSDKYQLKNETLLNVDDEIINQIAGLSPGEYRFQRDPLLYAPSTKPKLIQPGEEGLEISPEVPVTPDLPEISQYEEALQQNLPQDVAEDILMENIFYLRRNLKDTEKARQVLALWITRFESIWNIIVGLKNLLENNKPNIERLINVNIAKAKHTLDGIYNTMNTAEIIAVNHRNILWRTDDFLNRVGTTYGQEWATPISPQESEDIGLPTKRSPEVAVERLLTKTEYISWWLSEVDKREKVYSNIDEAARSAWRRYQNLVQLSGPFLVRHEGVKLAQQDIKQLINIFIEDLRDLEKSLQILDEDDNVLESLLFDLDKDIEEIPTLEKTGKYDIISPDGFKYRVAGIDEDDLATLEGDTRNLPIEEQIEQPTIREEPVQEPTELEPLPIDDDEFLRIRFPEITRLPTSIWGKIQLAGTRLHKIRISYTKVTPPEEGITKTYVVHPYSFRIRRPARTMGQPVWYMFADDDRDRHIKAFIYRNINSVEILPETFDPRWEVEFRYE